MKKILFLLLTLISFSAQSQVKVIAPVVQNAPSDTYPTHIDSLGMSGYMATCNIATRNAIPAARRREGMMVKYTCTSDSMFYLNNGITNSDWVLFSATGGAGAGTVFSVGTTYPVQGGTITGSGTINLDTVNNGGMASNYDVANTDSVGILIKGGYQATPIDTTYTNAVSNVIGISPITVTTGGKTKYVGADTTILATQYDLVGISSSIPGNVNEIPVSDGAGSVITYPYLFFDGSSFIVGNATYPAGLLYVGGDAAILGDGDAAVNGTQLYVKDGNKYIYMFSDSVAISNLSAGGMVVASAPNGKLSVQAIPTGTVTHTAGANTLDAVMLGAGGDDIKAATGITTNGSTTLTATTLTGSTNLSSPLLSATAGLTLKGGTNVGDSITYIPTTANGTDAGTAHNFLADNNGSLLSLRLLNNGGISAGTYSNNLAGYVGRAFTFSTGASTGIPFMEFQGRQTTNLFGIGGFYAFNAAGGANMMGAFQFQVANSSTTSAGMAVYTANAGTLAQNFLVNYNGNICVGSSNTPTARLHITNAQTTAASTAPLKLTAGTTKMSTPEAGTFEYSSGYGGGLLFTNAGGKTQEVTLIQTNRVATQFDAVATTTLADLPTLIDTVVAGKSYRFEAILFVDAAAAGGHKYAIGGTCTATNIIYQVESSFDLAPTGSIALDTRQTALAAASGEHSSAATQLFTRITGTITVNAAGNLKVQFAQNNASGTSSILVGSTFVTTQIQ